MKPKGLILIIEDDQAISDLLTRSLRQAGHKTLAVKDMRSAKRALVTYTPELILLDLGLPDGDGKMMIKEIHTTRKTPIIIVSARDDEQEIISTLDLGADDYVTKPFSTHILLARVRSVQRRYLGLLPATNIIECHDLRLDLDQYALYRDTTPLKLTPTEFNLLRYMMLRHDQVLTHDQILKEVWGVSYQNEMQYLRTYINSLRKKIEVDRTRPAYIKTELSIGYRLCCDQTCMT